MGELESLSGFCSGFEDVVDRLQSLVDLYLELVFVAVQHFISNPNSNHSAQQHQDQQYVEN
jgi:hypothetical protein